MTLLVEGCKLRPSEDPKCCLPADASRNWWCTGGSSYACKCGLFYELVRESMITPPQDLLLNLTANLPSDVNLRTSCCFKCGCGLSVEKTKSTGLFGEKYSFSHCEIHTGSSTGVPLLFGMFYPQGKYLPYFCSQYRSELN